MTKNPLINFFLVCFLILILFAVFYKGRKTMNSVFDNSKTYAKENANRILELENFIYYQDLLNDTILSSYVSFSFKSRAKVGIVRFSKKGRFATSDNAPNYLSHFFSGNKMQNLKVEKDGIVFPGIYRTWSWKICSLKYFFKPHGLVEKSNYEDKYLITKDDSNNLAEFCFIIDEHWILVVKNEN